MSFLNSIFARKKLPTPELSQDIQRRLSQWQALPTVDLTKTFAESDCVVVDLETSGFSFKNDHLIAIGACRLENGLIPLRKSFQIILKQDESSSKENILIHHIGDSDQRSGIEPVEALMQFLEYMAKAPLMAYHVGFDQPMLDKALKQYLGIELKQHTWFDVAFLAPLFLPDISTKRQNLDFWTKHFQINNPNRHSAVFDAISTAEVMQAVMKQPLKGKDGICVGESLDLSTLYKMEQRARKIHRQLHGGR
ncbi:MAG TPA: 3'-5' exonuclease [Oligella sp.]|nr:3'-5' exonuclease [Oligella sp.]